MKIYFPDVEFWRAEILRAGLFLQGIPYQNVTDNELLVKIMKRQYQQQERPETTAVTTTTVAPFGQLPILETYDGQILSQTQAMASYVGKLGSFYNVAATSTGDYDGGERKDGKGRKSCCECSDDRKGEEDDNNTKDITNNDDNDNNNNIVLPVSLVEYRLYPKDDEIFAQAKCDEIINGCIDITTTIGSTFTIQDEAEKERMQKELIDPNSKDGKLFKFFHGLNSIVLCDGSDAAADFDNDNDENNKNNDNDTDDGDDGDLTKKKKKKRYHSCGEQHGLTMADLAIYYLVKWFTNGTDRKNLKYVPMDFVLSTFPNLKNIYETVDNDKRIIKYMKEKQIALHACVQDFVRDKIDEQTKATLGLYKKKITASGGACCMKKECSQ